jgi:hypothetical protein
VDQPAEQGFWVTDQELALPVRELDGTLVLSSRAVLREEAWPRARVRGDLEVRALRAIGVATRAQPAAHLVLGAELPDCVLALIDDSRVPRVKEEPQLVDTAPVGRDASVAEVEAERVHVLGRKR